MQAYLILANGRVFRGVSVGCPGTTIGEVVFATGMVGFEETLTDPSYYGQIITQTYPLIGNYGLNAEDFESRKCWVSGFIMREACAYPSNWRCDRSLDEYLKSEGIVGLAGIDTRRLTRILRNSGVMNGILYSEGYEPTEQQIAEAERAMALLLGKLPFEIRRSTFEEVSEYSFPADVGIPAQLLRNRPDVRAAEFELLASKSDVSAARKAFFPSLVIGGGGGFNAFSLEKWFSSPASLVYNLAAGITAPVFRRNELRSLWQEAKSRQRIALLGYHDTALRAYQEVVNLMTASEQMNQRKALKKEESRIHHRSIYNANELFKTGFVGYLDVLSADERYLDCELERIRLNISYCKMHVMLYRSLGGGQL